jgi:hypothetical protein
MTCTAKQQEVGIGWETGTRTACGGQFRGKFENEAQYRTLLTRVFGAAARMMKANAMVYVRPMRGVAQTRLFGNGHCQPGEVGLVLLP